MDNASRSERTRKAVIQAALMIITRDGPARLTMDAIAKESGISKGGVMHQFPTKDAVLRALLEHQIEYFSGFSSRFMAEQGKDYAQPQLAAQIAAARQALTDPQPVAFAILGALAQDPSLLSSTQTTNIRKMGDIRAEAADPDLALLQWLAAQGLALTTMFGMSPFDEAERERLFQRLLDDNCRTLRQQPSKNQA